MMLKHQWKQSKVLVSKRLLLRMVLMMPRRLILLQWKQMKVLMLMGPLKKMALMMPMLLMLLHWEQMMRKR